MQLHNCNTVFEKWGSADCDAEIGIKAKDWKRSLLENSFCVSVGLGKLVWNGPSLGCMISSLISALRLGVNFFSLFLLPFVSLLFLTWAIWFSCKSNLFPYLLDRFVLGPGRMFLSACLIFTSWVCPDMFLFTHGWPVCLHSLMHLQIHMGM